MGVAMNWPGKLEWADVAAKLDLHPVYVRGLLQDKTAPQLKPCFRVGTAHIYDEAEVEIWLEKFKAWRSGEPVRIEAAKKRDQDAIAAAFARSAAEAKSRQEQLDTAAYVQAQIKERQEAGRELAELQGRQMEALTRQEMARSRRS